MSNSANLSFGVIGERVAALQKSLQGRGAYLPSIETMRAYFGPATRQAVLQFQQRQALPITGVVDQRTAAALGLSSGPQSSGTRLPDASGPASEEPLRPIDVPERPVPTATSQTVDLGANDIQFEGLRGGEPLLLIPVRIETRFADTQDGPQLWVRIFPDQFSIDSHNPSLTADEWAGALQSWDAMWPLAAGEVDGQKQAWASLAAAFGPRRAAYVADATGPADFDAWVTGPSSAVLGTNRTPPQAPPSGLASHSWTQPAVARALPTQWFVMLVSGGATQVIEVTRPHQDLVVSPDPGAAGSAGEPGGPTYAMTWLSDFEKAQRVGMAVAIDISAEQRAGGFDQVVVFGLSSTSGLTGAAVLESLLSSHHYTDGFAFVPQGTATKNSPDSISGYSRSDPNFATSFSVERSGPLIPTSIIPSTDLISADAADGQLFARVLAIDPSSVSYTQYSDQTDQQDAVAMATACWPATGDYFLRYMIGTQTDADNAGSYPAICDDGCAGTRPDTGISRGDHAVRYPTCCLDCRCSIGRSWRCRATGVPHSKGPCNLGGYIKEFSDSNYAEQWDCP